MKNKLLNYFNQQSKALFDNYLKAMERQREEDIHQLRVSIKNLRVLFSFFEIASHGAFNKRDHFMLLSRLFRRAGEVREAQVNLQLIGRNKSGYWKPYIKFEKNIQKRKNRKLLKEMEKFDLRKWKKLNRKLLKKVKKISDKVVHQRLSFYLFKKLKKIYKLINQQDKKIQLHQIRIHIKVVNEVLSIMNKLDVIEELTDFQKDLKSLSGMTGTWHDYAVCSSSMKKFVNQKKHQKHLRQLKKEIKRMQQQNRKRRIKILERLYKLERIGNFNKQ